MSATTGTAELSRREFARMLGGALALGGFAAGPALAQACAVLPTIGKVRVASLDVIINGTRVAACQTRRPALPGLSVVVAAARLAGVDVCRLEVAGAAITAEMTLAALPGVRNAYCGRLGFVQFAQYTYQRSPAGLGPAGGNSACARSTGWELDSGGPAQTYNGRLRCRLGTNKKSMFDSPGVPTEDARTAYDTVSAGPVGTITAPNLFRTWVVWDTTDDSRPPSAANALRRHPLARIDWAWQGLAGNAGPGAACPSAVPHPGNGWSEKGASGTVTGVRFGPAAGAPPTKFIRTHNNVWVAGPC
ncbi:MAG TPA: hypothetical protein VGR91_14465 [Stellaceae bacterium]|nr:hypothetical protein [Stellaceae bacterium]